MNNKICLSIIIPAHNCARTLEKAVNSIENSNGKVEIIIVENASTDNTYNVAKQIKNKRQNIILTSSEKGVSNARNKGLALASGQKVMFLDSDDYYQPKAIEFVLNHMSADLDIYSYQSGGTDKKMFDRDHVYTGNEKIQFIGKMLTFPTSYLTVWGKAFNTQLIRNHHLKFQNNLSLSEDSLFLIEYVSFCKSIAGHMESIYYYSLSSESAVRKYDPETVSDYLKSLKAVRNFIMENFPAIQDYYYKYGLMQLNLIGVHGIFDRSNSASFNSKMSRLKETISDPLISECLSKTKIQELKSIKFLAIILIKLHLTFLACQVFELRNRISF